MGDIDQKRNGRFEITKKPQKTKKHNVTLNVIALTKQGFTFKR